MKTIKTLAAFAILMLFATASEAQSYRSKVQHRRIAQGYRNGELTRFEARQLARQQQHIRRETRMARADGHISSCERKELRREKRKASRNIYWKKHNRRDRI